MTKFVAAVFLPLVYAATLLVHPGAAAVIRSRWREWILPAAVAFALVSGRLVSIRHRDSRAGRCVEASPVSPPYAPSPSASGAAGARPRRPQSPRTRPPEVVCEPAASPAGGATR